MAGWVVELRGKSFDKIAARLPEIKEWAHDCVPTKEMAKRVGVGLASFRIYIRAAGVTLYPAYVVTLVERYPDLKPLLHKEGVIAFMQAAGERKLVRRQIIQKVQADAQATALESQLRAIENMHKKIADGVDRNEAIRATRAAGVTLEAIGTSLGVTRERIRQVCEARNVFRPNMIGGPRVSVNEINDLYRKGFSKSEIAGMLGAHYRTIHRRCDESIVTRREWAAARRAMLMRVADEKQVEPAEEKSTV